MPNGPIIKNNPEKTQCLNTHYPNNRHTRIVVILAFLFVLSGCSNDNHLPGEGTWRIINYWAIWCAPCREEVPILNAINTKKNITVLGVNFDNKIGQSLEYQRKQLAIEFKSMPVDPSKLLGIARPQVLPTTLIVNPQGVLVDTLIGPQTEISLLTAISLNQDTSRVDQAR